MPVISGNVLRIDNDSYAKTLLYKAFASFKISLTFYLLCYLTRAGLTTIPRGAKSNGCQEESNDEEESSNEGGACQAGRRDQGSNDQVSNDGGYR
jgi:hypothetical protein